MVNFMSESGKLKQGLNIHLANQSICFKYLKGDKCKCLRLFLTPKKIWTFGTLFLLYTTTQQNPLPEWVNYC